MTMKERLIKALEEAMGPEEDIHFPQYPNAVETILIAMREPTETMCNAKVPNTYDIEGIPMNEPGALDNTCATWVWKAMIDEALR